MITGRDARGRKVRRDDMLIDDRGRAWRVQATELPLVFQFFLPSQPGSDKTLIPLTPACKRASPRRYRYNASRREITVRKISFSEVGIRKHL